MERQTADDFVARRIDVDGADLVVFSWTPGSPPASPCAARKDRLTAAERAVCALLIIGLSDAEIATLRGTTRSTITKQVDAIFRKLGVRSRRELIASTSERNGAQSTQRT